MIAQDLLQLIALKYSASVWKQHTLYLRTQSRDLQSERTVRHMLTVIYNQQLFYLQQNGIIQKMRAQFMAMFDDEGGRIQ